MTATATRTTKNETITRSIAIATAANGTCVASVTEAHKRKSEPKLLLDTYFLRSIVSKIGGTAIEIEKLGESEVHHVLLEARGNGHKCDCKWGTYKSHVKPCRHVEMCLQAIQEGKI
jgi:hypothetical protein